MTEDEFYREPELKNKMDNVAELVAALKQYFKTADTLCNENDVRKELLAKEPKYSRIYNIEPPSQLHIICVIVSSLLAFFTFIYCLTEETFSVIALLFFAFFFFSVCSLILKKSRLKTALSNAQELPKIIKEETEKRNKAIKEMLRDFGKEIEKLSGISPNTTFIPRGVIEILEERRATTLKDAVSIALVCTYCSNRSKCYIKLKEPFCPCFKV